MAEQKGIDINDSDASKLSPLEELDPDDEIEILSDENNEIESLEEVEVEAVGQEETDSSMESDTDTTHEDESLSEQGDGKKESAGKENDAEEVSKKSDEEDDEEFDLEDYDDDGFLGLDDEELDDNSIEEQDVSSESEEVVAYSPKDDQSERESEEKAETMQHEEESSDKKKDAKKANNKSKAEKTIKKPSLVQIFIAMTVVVLIIAGGYIYTNSSLIGLTSDSSPAPPEAADQSPPVQIDQIYVEATKPPSKNEIYLAKIDEAGRLKDELLAKNEEIYRLKLHYENGIADLEEQISREIQKESITSYAQAMKKKSIELNLRTIQRRRSYIHGLEKPTQWIKQGSEEIIFLKRKAEYDLQLIDIAAGIDMEKHMRHIAAAIQQYRPCAEKLAVDRKTSDLPSLETIWDQIKNRKKNKGQSRYSAADKEITKEICAGNFERIAELISMSVEAAQCLAKMNGPDLFLNNLTEITPAAAKHLFQWHGNWICINGVKELSPAAAQHLFKWKGNWISLNGLTEFPPELATYLMEWEGNQLELMGLKYDKKNADQKTLKYLALWETTGGKLFISDDVRKEIARVIM